MTRPLFFGPADQVRSAEPGADFVLGGDEGRHAATVRRLVAGERIDVSDGAGYRLGGVIAAVGTGTVELRVETAGQDPAPRHRLVLVQALAKGDRDELAVQAATELGVSGVVPWSAERSVVRWEGPKRAKGEERWRSIVREASKQSVRATLPEVAPLATSGDVARLTEVGTVLVLEPTAEDRLAALTLPADADRVYLVVGPEGGIAPGELDRFRAAGARLVRLGREVLRTSTAGPSALAVLSANSGRW